MSDLARARAILFEVLAIDSTWGRERALAEHLADRFAGWGLHDVRLVDVPDAGGPSGERYQRYREAKAHATHSEKIYSIGPGNEGRGRKRFRAG